MQISRFWRLYAQMLRFEGVRYQNGDVSLQHRPNYAEAEVKRRADEAKLKAIMAEVRCNGSKERY